MVNIKELKNKQKEIIVNLSEEELKQYILYLTRCYYNNFNNDDETLFNYNLNLLKDISENYKEVYPNIIGFIYYNLFLNANILLAETKTDSQIKLTDPFKYNLYESEEIEEELTHDIEKIFNKERVKERYNNEK